MANTVSCLNNIFLPSLLRGNPSCFGGMTMYPASRLFFSLSDKVLSIHEIQVLYGIWGRKLRKGN